MSEEADPAADIREWMLKVLRERPELSATSWAKKAGLAGTTVQRAIKPDYKFVTSSRTLAKLAAVVGSAPPEVRKSGEAQIAPRFLPVRYKVQAGLWEEVDEFAQAWVGPAQPVAPDPSYGDWPQWLEEVVGDSVNLKISPGAYAHVVDAVAMGYAPRDGDWVVVERRRAGGLRERTIKQVAITSAGGVELWPRSSNPRWSEPVRLTEATREGEEVEVEIVARVIGAYQGGF